MPESNFLQRNVFFGSFFIWNLRSYLYIGITLSDCNIAQRNGKIKG